MNKVDIRKSKPTRLMHFIRSMGAETFAKQYEVPLRVAQSYMWGDRTPPPDSPLAQKFMREGTLGEGAKTFFAIWGLDD